MLEIRPVASSLADVLAVAGDQAPYLNRLIRRDRDDLAIDDLDGLASQFAPWLDAWKARLAVTAKMDEATAALRKFKREAHLLIALQDLAGVADVPAVTQRLTAMADLAVDTALRTAAAKRGLSTDGLVILALGKHGAGELNYSSDIDLVALYDDARFHGGDRGPGDAASRIIRDVITLLEAQTGDGYVFRTDFRLRPDPSSTPVAVSTAMAETYYESVGQNWERMVYIKARPCAGDRAAGDAFLRDLIPFVWRRHLDYWAIADIHAIKRMINTKLGDPALGDIESDLKLGPGGIREIEFFAQTQQVILGGRDPALRDPTTCGALARLADAGVIEPDIANALTHAYELLRAVEHRVQMLNDEQTHSLPSTEEGRTRVARLCGDEALDRFERGLLALRETVHGHYRELFSEEERKSDAALGGNLVFTGVDPDPATLKTLSALGFNKPERVISSVQAWHRGRVPATRTPRGRQLLTAVLPDLLVSMGQTGEADTAFERFATFFEGLSAGVQLLSMLLAEERLRADLISTLALAPRLAQTLSRAPECLEAMIDGGERDRLALPAEIDFEGAMNEARRYHREATLLIGHRLLQGGMSAAEVGDAWTTLADETVTAMATAAERETTRRFGPPPGHWHVFAMGKLGGRELTAGSDLDLIVLFDPAAGASDPQTWFTRFTQRFITALSAPTGEGLLYEIDMRLRPSGRAGPVAVSLTAFERYQNEEAWTWEHMALTRLRAIAGDTDLADRALAVARAAIVHRAGRETILTDVADMRSRLVREKPSAGPWDLKYARGGLVDIEFITQAALLKAGDPALITGNTDEALDRLGRAGLMAPDIAAPLQSSLRFQQSLLQVLRLAIGDVQGDREFSDGVKDRLCRAVAATDFDGLKKALLQHRSLGAEHFSRFLQVPATD